MNENPLKKHEWIAFFLFMLFISVIGKMSWNAPIDRWPRSLGKPIDLPEDQLIIYFSGEVEKKGRFHFPRGTLLQEALNHVGLKTSADVSKLALNSPLKGGQRINVRKKNKRLRENL